jgi:hypothetical protein
VGNVSAGPVAWLVRPAAWAAWLLPRGSIQSRATVTQQRPQNQVVARSAAGMRSDEQKLRSSEMYFGIMTKVSKWS